MDSESDAHPLSNPQTLLIFFFALYSPHRRRIRVIPVCVGVALVVRLALVLLRNVVAHSFALQGRALEVSFGLQLSFLFLLIPIVTHDSDCYL